MMPPLLELQAIQTKQERLKKNPFCGGFHFVPFGFEGVGQHMLDAKMFLYLLIANLIICYFSNKYFLY